MNFSILCLFLVNGPQALYVETGCFKCISDINLFETSKNLFAISFSLYTTKLKQNIT